MCIPVCVCMQGDDYNIGVVMVVHSHRHISSKPVFFVLLRIA